MTQAYRIRRHPNARRVTLKVLPDQSLEVVAPRQISERRIARFVRDQHDWIQAAKGRVLRQQRARSPLLDDPFPNRINLPSIGSALYVSYDESRARSRLQLDDEPTLLIAGSKTAERVATELIQAMKAIAKQRLEPRLHEIVETHGYCIEHVSWRNQKSRWGSCRRIAENIGRISLNIRLLLLPPTSADYVLIHELAHIDHPNHSAAFWQRVEQMQPDYRDHQRAIKRASLNLPRWIL